MKEPTKKNLYLCDPNKNTECSGRFKPHCGIQCFCTTNKAYAKDPKPLTFKDYDKKRKKVLS